MMFLICVKNSQLEARLRNLEGKDLGRLSGSSKGKPKIEVYNKDKKMGSGGLITPAKVTIILSVFDSSSFLLILDVCTYCLCSWDYDEVILTVFCYVQTYNTAADSLLGETSAKSEEPSKKKDKKKKKKVEEEKPEEEEPSEKKKKKKAEAETEAVVEVAKEEKKKNKKKRKHEEEETTETPAKKKDKKEKKKKSKD
jgi:nucleolar protein 58